MPGSIRKHLPPFCFAFPILFIVACTRHSNTPNILTAPSRLRYLPDTAIVLNGVADTSVTPLIDWNGRKGTFSFLAPVSQGITIDNQTGKISWISSLPIGTYILPVVASSGASLSDTASYTLTISGKIVTIAGGVQGFSGDGGYAANAQFNMPYDVTTDASGNIYIADSYNNRIRKITPDGIIRTIAGNGTYGFAGDGGLALQAKLYAPSGIALDAQGNCYITDYGSNRIRKIDAGGIITTVAGSDNSNAPNLGDGGPATQAWIHLVGGKVALDAQGSLYIADLANQRVRKVTPDGIIHTITGTGNWGAGIPDGTPVLNASIAAPCGLSFDASGTNLYIVSNYASMVYRLNAGDIYTAAGVYDTWGEEGSSGDGGPAIKATLYRPTNAVTDKDGNLFIADFANNRIRKVDTKGIITTVAGNGTQGVSGDGGPAAAAQLTFPIGLATDANGDLYIADTYNNRIRKVILH